MKIAVLGGGVIGVTTAYYLAKAGHSVEVFERRAGPGLETSFANAGEISPGYASPWAGPGVPLKAIKWLFMKHSPLVIQPTLDPSTWMWIARTLANCTTRRYALNKSRMMRVALYSRQMLANLRSATGLKYDERTQGTLQLFRTQRQIDAAANDVEVLKQYGVQFELLDRSGCIRAEPGLARVQAIVAGGLRLPADETGDCRKFTVQLAELARSLGVTFHFGVSLRRLVSQGAHIVGIETDSGLRTADRYVTALGSYSPLILRQLGLPVPIIPVKGYSITLPVTNAEGAPLSTVMDETYKVAITRLGERIRAGGTAELAGYDTRLSENRRATLERSVRDLFPGGGEFHNAEFWAGLRSMTPDGTPIIGATRLRNLFINTGHGTLGWTMACGSARIVADLISGRAPDIDVRDLALARYA
ncbi:MAG: D-amino acid dehydrogenase [Gammaproteobacteria bacterium]|nr:D-amino acid dehydrogenase [Gammaproteobacteria bacterium]